MKRYVILFLMFLFAVGVLVGYHAFVQPPFTSIIAVDVVGGISALGLLGLSLQTRREGY